MVQITIRPFEPEDVEGYHRIYSHPDVVREQLDLPLGSLDERRKQVVQSRNHRYLVAERDAAIVGAGDLMVYRWRRGHVGNIGLAVDPEHWRTGVGSALLQALIDLGERWYGLRRIELKVFDDNQRAIELLEHFGFEVEATHRDFALRDGELATAIALARLKDGGN